MKLVAVLVGSAALVAAPCAAAEPGPSCPASGALTKLQGGTVLTCSGGTWTPFGGPYPFSDTWVSDAAGITLHGQGLRNPEIMSGQWTGAPLNPDAVCGVQQASVVAAGEVGPTRVDTGQAGQPLDVVVQPVVFTITLTGDCLWQKR